MSTAAYAGRKFDVMAFQGVLPRGQAQLTPALALPGNSGTACTGVQKIAQRFLLEFLTERGSLRYLPERGCSFMTRLRQGRMRTATDVFVEFSLAMNQVEAALINDNADDDPDDEVFVRAELLNVALSSTTIQLRIAITTRAGTARPILLPVAWPV